ncbi:hypothetical protein ACIF6L_14970 [Kitasatospora sp. NPDC086009]|uniref:hypothetical protein n=1 Tax=unclassified Kitasatospora TaxID=2633591 RepID=UPI0037CB7CB0
MSATCPQCEASDRSVPVSRALADTTEPLEEPVRALLAPPPEPKPARELSGGAIALSALAAIFAVVGILSLVRDREDLSGYDAAYRAGYLAGPFILPLILLGAAAIVELVARSRRRPGSGSPEEEAHRQPHARVWQAGWLCRRCRVAFFPEASIRPGFPASPAIPLEQFPHWVMTAAERAFGAQARPVAG